MDLRSMLVGMWGQGLNCDTVIRLLFWLHDALTIDLGIKLILVVIL